MRGPLDIRQGVGDKLHIQQTLQSEWNYGNMEKPLCKTLVIFLLVVVTI